MIHIENVTCARDVIERNCGNPANKSRSRRQAYPRTKCFGYQRENPSRTDINRLAACAPQT